MKSAAVLAAVLVAALGCTEQSRYQGTVPPPGADPRHYAPLDPAVLSAVVAYAGAGGVIATATMMGVREDGTIDLTASYPSYATYEVSAPASSPPGKPVGGGGFAGPGHKRVDVDVRKPDQGMSVTEGSGAQWNYTDRGMSKREGSPEVGAVVGRVQPTCAPARLWQIAKTRGAPAGAVASIRWDGKGYDFFISGTPVNVRFNASCDVINGGIEPAPAVAPEPAVEPPSSPSRVRRAR